MLFPGKYNAFLPCIFFLSPVYMYPAFKKNGNPRRVSISMFLTIFIEFYPDVFISYPGLKLFADNLNFCKIFTYAARYRINPDGINALGGQYSFNEKSPLIIECFFT